MLIFLGSKNVVNMTMSTFVSVFICLRLKPENESCVVTSSLKGLLFSLVEFQIETLSFYKFCNTYHTTPVDAKYLTIKILRRMSYDVTFM